MMVGAVAMALVEPLRKNSAMFIGEKLERAAGIEPATSSLGIPRLAGKTRNPKDETKANSWGLT
jgi:hypothetical protein